MTTREPSVKPAVWALLCFMEKNEKEQGKFSEKALLNGLAGYGFDPADCKTALAEAFKQGLVFPSGILSPVAKEMLFPAKVFGESVSSRRVGGKRHIELLRKQARNRRSAGSHAQFDTGEDTHEQAPDILITPLLKDEKGHASATTWDLNEQFAVEAEVDPKGHQERVVQNYLKNKDAGRYVSFVTLAKGKEPEDADEMEEMSFKYGLGLILEILEKRGCNVGSYPVGGTVHWLDEDENGKEQLKQYELFRHDGYHLSPRRIGKHEYLYARKSVGGSRIYRSLGPLSADVKKLLEGGNKGGKAGGKGGGKAGCRKGVKGVVKVPP